MSIYDAIGGAGAVRAADFDAVVGHLVTAQQVAS
jgi:hypothetical protein